ncbi:MAG: hypothetical protein RLZ98_314 [Pseudomonadota bacterium]|jgi:endonuclease YncB( thermonuclease family)
MFGRKKNDGFEWHRYVRTTIKLRREDRRRRIAEAKGAAAVGLKQAGAHGAAAGRSIAALAWNWIANALTGLWWLLVILADRLWRGVVWTASTAARWVAHAAGTASRAILRLPPVPTLVATGLALAGSAYLWKLNFGADRMTLWAEGLGLVAIGAGAVLWASPLLLARLPRKWRSSRLLSGIQTTRLAPVAAAAAGVMAIAAGGWWTWHNAGAVTLPAMPALNFFASADTGIEGRAVAVSGDTIGIAGKLIKLADVEAPRLGQTCRARSGRRWDCGKSARSALARLVRQRKVTCSTARKSPESRAVARCRTQEGDLGAALVAGGHAFAATGLFASYSGEEASARQKQIGIWRGKPERPS